MPKNSMKILINSLYFFGVLFVSFGFWYIIFDKNYINSINVTNINLEKSVSVEELINNYKNLSRQSLKPIYYNDVLDAIANAKYFPTSFKGKLTHYGPDCALCGGTLGCNGRSAKDGNIYYDDKEYGTIRIIASTKKIPCGSIIRINVDKYDKNGILAIVLDRGVGPGVIDLLKVTEKSWAPTGTVNNVVFDIVRYGY